MAELLKLINNTHIISKEEDKIAIKVNNEQDYNKFVAEIKEHGGYGIEYDSWSNHKESSTRNYKDSICIQLRHMLGNTEYCDANYFINKGYEIYDYKHTVFNWDSIKADNKTKYSLTEVIYASTNNKKIAIHLTNKEEYETFYNAVRKEHGSWMCMSESKFFEFDGTECIHMVPRMTYQCSIYHYRADGYKIININDIVLED